MVIIGNGLAGVWALAAHWLEGLRTRALWWFVVAVQAAMFVQVGLGVVSIQVEGFQPAQFHMFYGFVALVAIALLYAYRSTSPWVEANRYVVYGLGGLFVMGLGIRALLVGSG